MNHQALAEKVVDLALGALSPREAREVEAHVAGCARCAAELASLRGARQAMAALPPLPAPERGEAVLMAAARQAAEQATRRPPGLLPRWLWGAAFGAASVAAAVLVTLQLSGAPPPSRFEEGREALLGREPATVAAAPERPEPQAAAPTSARAGAAEPSRVGPAAAAANGARAEVPRREGERFAKAEAASPPPARAGAAAAMKAPAPPPMPAALEARRDHARAAAPEEARAEAAAELAAPDPAPARRAREAVAGLADSKAPAPRPASAPASGSLSARAGQPPGAPRAELRTFPGCPGERSRALTRDAAGRLLRRDRAGVLAGVPYQAEERYGEDGRLAGAVVRFGGREVSLGPAELAGDRLEALPGLDLALTAEAAEAAPPACGP